MSVPQTFVRWFAALVWSAGPLVGTGLAQQNQPIYPSYEGFMKNADGTLTLSFGYYSHNAEVITIPPGADNSFAPTPEDRQQPTVFKPGHWERQCVMVVPGNFDGKLTWNLAYAGKATSTSTRMLQSNWFLVEAVDELTRSIDLAKAKHGVCLNRAPEVSVLGTVRKRGAPSTLATPMDVGATESLFGSVHDEGLPRGKPVTASWKQISGPGTARFERADTARTHVVFSAPGEYVLELTGSDSELNASTRVTVTVVK
ncbi:MAG: hypothetical protein FJW27_02385 [Acidimicrobiia bacterium]|nr:hypothetical protein [Acidimicrobiia bacterium]